MKFIMGLKKWYSLHATLVSRIVLILMIIFDSYMALLIYKPQQIENLHKVVVSNYESITKKLPLPSLMPTKLAKQNPSPTPSPTPTTNTNNENVEASPRNTPTPTTSPSPSPSQIVSLTPTPTSTPTPTPTSTPTPTPSTMPSTLPTSTPTPTQNSTSAVYITGYIITDNQQIVAEQNPVKVINTSTNEVIASAETGNDGKSPTWQIPANTAITVTLYPKPGFNGCGEVWQLTTGSLGTMESKNLSIVGERTPCLIL